MKRNQMLIVVCLLLTFMCVANAETMYVHVGEETFLNGRHDPRLNSAVEMRLYRGDEVMVLGIDGSWARRSRAAKPALPGAVWSTWRHTRRMRMRRCTPWSLMAEYV